MMSHTERARRALRGAAFVALGALAVTACDEDTAPPFEVEGEGSISGLLFYDEGRDGVFEPLEGDTVLPGIDLHLAVRGSGSVIPGTETQTDAAGNFTITNVPAGTHDLVFDAEELDAGGVVVCQNPREVSVRISEVTAVSISSQVSCLITLAEARALADDEVVTVRGVVTVGTGDISGSYFFLQDETAGIKVFGGAAQVGEFIEVTGFMDTFSGEREIAGPQITRLGTAPEPEPAVITGAELLSSDFQGSLVTVEGLEVVSVTASGNPINGYDVRVTAPDGSNFIVRVDIDVGIDAPSVFTVGGTYNVSGVVSPFGGAEQLYVRVMADIEEVE